MQSSDRRGPAPPCFGEGPYSLHLPSCRHSGPYAFTLADSVGAFLQHHCWPLLHPAQLFEAPSHFCPNNSGSGPSPGVSSHQVKSVFTHVTNAWPCSTLTPFLQNSKVSVSYSIDYASRIPWLTWGLDIGRFWVMIPWILHLKIWRSVNAQAKFCFMSKMQCCGRPRKMLQILRSHTDHSKFSWVTCCSFPRVQAHSQAVSSPALRLTFIAGTLDFIFWVNLPFFIWNGPCLQLSRLLCLLLPIKHWAGELSFLSMLLFFC